jgi:hypothetical protein
MAKPKIFGVGPNHTGTRSLNKALEILGYKSRHDHQANKLDLETLSFDELDAYLDGPLREKFKDLDAKYPAAKFILSTRDKESWITSRIIHVLRNRVFADNPWTEINTWQWRREYDALHVAVPAHFAARPGKLLVVDFTKEANPWLPLCQFLGEPIPDVLFPWWGRGTDTLRRCLVQMRATRPPKPDKEKQPK